MKIYETTCPTWDDGEWGTEAASPMEAAIRHAIDGWQNQEIEVLGEDEEPVVGERVPVEIRVTDPHGDITTLWYVRYDSQTKIVTAEQRASF